MMINNATLTYPSTGGLPTGGLQVIAQTITAGGMSGGSGHITAGGTMSSTAPARMALIQ